MTDDRRRAYEARRAAAEERRDRVLSQARARREAAGERREAAGERRVANLERARRAREISLVDLVDRLLDGGVVIHGDITLAVADVDLVYVGLRALVASVETVEREMGVELSARGAALDASPT